MSVVLGLGLEHSCPWPREGLFSETLSLALAFASDFFLCPWPWPRALYPRLHLWYPHWRFLAKSVAKIIAGIFIGTKVWKLLNEEIMGERLSSSEKKALYQFCLVVKFFYAAIFFHQSLKFSVQPQKSLCKNITEN